MQQVAKKMNSFDSTDELGDSFLKDFNLCSPKCSELLQIAACEMLTQCMKEIRKCGENDYTSLSEDEIRKMCFSQRFRDTFTFQLMRCVGYWSNDLEYAVIKELMRIGLKTPLVNSKSDPKNTYDIIYGWIEKKTGIKFE